VRRRCSGRRGDPAPEGNVGLDADRRTIRTGVEPIDFLVSDSPQGRQFIELKRQPWTGSADDYAERTLRVLRNPRWGFHTPSNRSMSRTCGSDAYRVASRFGTRPDGAVNVSIIAVIGGYVYEARYFRHADMTPIDGWEDLLRSFCPIAPIR
jgi:hypothetical protein